MPATPANIQIALAGPTVWLKLTGRANHLISADFKRVLERMKADDRRSYAFDLTDCLLLDSTFLGILAGLAQDLADDTQNPGTIQLVHPNERITDFLDNLGVLNLFQIAAKAAPQSASYESVSAGPVDKTELSITSLEAHQRLMALNPANVPKFRDVVTFLEEELRRAQPQVPPQTPTPPPKE